MYNTINNIGKFITFTLQLSLFLGIFVVLMYVIANLFSESRIFNKSPRSIRQLTYRIIEFSHIWGPKLIILYLLGNLLVQFLNFIL